MITGEWYASSTSFELPLPDFLLGGSGNSTNIKNSHVSRIGYGCDSLEKLLRLFLSKSGQSDSFLIIIINIYPFV